MMRGRKIFRILMAVTTVAFLVGVQPFDVYAATGVSVSKEQADEIVDETADIITKFAVIGLDSQDVADLFSLVPRESDFYEKEARMEVPISAESTAVRTGTDAKREQIKDTFQIAKQYYRSAYYDKTMTAKKDFGTYFTYLYISQYVDTPQAQTTENDLVYILSDSDIKAYDKFMKDARLSEWSKQMRKLGNILYTDMDCDATLDAVIELNRIITDGYERIEKEADKGTNQNYDIDEALKTIAPMVKNYIMKHHDEAVRKKDLIQDTSTYVREQLDAMDFYECYDEKITVFIIDILTESLIEMIHNKIPLIDCYVAVKPLSAYENGTIQSPALIALRYSYSSRYVMRTTDYFKK